MSPHPTSGADRIEPSPDDDLIRWPDPSPLDLWWQRIMSDTLRRSRDSSTLETSGRRPPHPLHAQQDAHPQAAG